MANEVEIRITANDLTGPAFASAMSKLAALKAAADSVASSRQIDFGIGDALAQVAALKAAMKGLNFGRVDTSMLGASLTALRSKIQSLGIADIADVDVQPGRLMTQLQLIKRLINQAGISDVLDFNLRPTDLTSQLDKLGQIEYNIPVKFDTSKMPPLGKIGTESVPIVFDTSRAKLVGPTGTVFNIPANVEIKDFMQNGEVMPVIRIPVSPEFSGLPKLGLTEEAVTVPVKLDYENAIKPSDVSLISSATEAERSLAQATQDAGRAAGQADFEWSPLMKHVFDLADSANEGQKYMSMLGACVTDFLPYAHQLGSVIKDNVVPSLGGLILSAHNLAALFGGGLIGGLSLAGLALGRLNDNISRGIPVWKSAGGFWGAFTGHLVTFGGAISSLLPANMLLQDMLGANVSGWHLMLDAILETGATLGPAIIGIAAFASSAVNATKEIYTHFTNMNKAITMTGQNVYPLTGAFEQMNEAAKPEVYVLLGEGLQIVAKNSGALQTVALATGKVLDDLGARFTYAVTQGSGFGVFVRNSAKDLAGWGNLIGNIGGIFGNVFKQMPGYAEILLNVANGVTHVAESITGSGLGQAVIGFGLAFHGAVVYIGILGTAAAVLISRTLPLLATGLMNVGLVVDRIGFSAAGAAIGDFAAEVSSAAALPWGWITLAAAGVAVLVYELLSAKSAAQQFADSVQKTITDTKLSSLGSTLANDMENYSIALDQATAQTAKLKAATGTTHLQMVGHDQVQQVTTYSAATNDAAQSMANYSAALAQVRSDQATYNSNLAQAAKVFGSNQAALAALTNAGITSAQMLTTNKQQMAQNIIEAESYNSAIRALTDGTGRYAAAMNALSGPQQYLGDDLKSIQSITQAQDNLMQVVTSGENSWNTFALGQQTLAGNFGLTAKQAQTLSHSLGDIKLSSTTAGATMGGLNQASLTLSQSFYSQVNNAQQVINSLEQQEASTKSLTTAVATLAGQMLPFAQNDEAARATLVAMINDALGPGTVSLQNLNTWVKNNATSMQGLNSIMEASTIKAGTLANVLQNQLNAQFQADLLVSSGAKQAMSNFTDAVVNGGSKTAAYASARARLISDLEATGMSAQDATSYVNGLQTKINAMHGTTVTVNANTGSAIANIDGVITQLNNIPQNVSSFINTYNITHMTTYTNTVALPPARAMGGIVGFSNFAASGGAKNGLTLVGELGPELVRLPQGSHVYPHGVTPGYATQGDNSQNLNVALQISGNGQSAFDRFMLEWMRNTVRVKGRGDVQKAFGKNL